MMKLRRLAYIPTLKCTLNCKLCCNSIPMYNHPTHTPVEKVCSDLDRIFDTVDHIEWFQFVGGEIFMHPNMGEIISYVQRYHGQFNKLILMTNGTLVPSESILSALVSYGDSCEVQISDYAQYSYKLDENVRAFAQRGIPCVVKSYHGDMQHYGGWVDNTDFGCRDYSPDELQQVFQSCWQLGMNNYHCYDGKLHNCIRSLFGLDLGLIPVPDDEYVDLYNDSLSREQKRAIIEQFNSRPLTACQYCNGFDSKNAKRYPAAEQVMVTTQ